MGKYTISVLELVKQYTSDKYHIKKRIDLARERIFSFDYPIWSQEHKRDLEHKILMRYLNKEIAFEVPSLWKLYLSERLCSIMPYYIELYKSTQQEYDMLTDVRRMENTVRKDNSEKNYTDNVSGHTTSVRDNNSGEDTANHSVEHDITTSTSTIDSQNNTQEGKEENSNSGVIYNTLVSDMENKSVHENIQESTNRHTILQHNSGFDSNGGLNFDETVASPNVQDVQRVVTTESYHSDYPQSTSDLTNYASTHDRVIVTTSAIPNTTIQNKENTKVVHSVNLTDETTEDANRNYRNSTADTTATDNKSSRKSGTDKTNQTSTTDTDSSQTEHKTDQIDGTQEKRVDTEGTSNTTFAETGNTDVTQSDLSKTLYEDVMRNDYSVYGNTGKLSFPELIIKFRSAIINIDDMVVSELHDLFMKIY